MIGSSEYPESYSRVDTLAGLLPIGSIPTPGGSDSPGFNDPSDAVYTTRAGRVVVFVADGGNHRIKEIDMETGAVTTLAGSGSLPGFVNGAAVLAKFRNPRGLAVTSSGLVLVADTVRPPTLALRTASFAPHTLPCNSRHTPETLNPIHPTRHPTPDTFHPTPYTLSPTPFALYPTPFTLHPAPYTLKPYTLRRGTTRSERST